MSIHVCAIGNLGRDPEIRRTQNDTEIANLSIACYAGKAKDGTTKTEWLRVTVFNQHMVGRCRSLRKGQPVGIMGAALETRKWQDQSGQDRYTTEVVVTPYKGEVLDLSPRDRQAGRDDTGATEDIPW